jgi:Ni/Fe-hydrogenase 1 B-type cytochrome subunit
VTVPPREIVYVWEVPVRLTHWIVALAIVVLTVTGLFIGGPYLRGGNFLMLDMKAWHLDFAVVLLCAVLWRLVWLFTGNAWSSWRGIVPFATPGWLQRAIETMLWYGFLRRTSPAEVGHNPLAAMAYIGVYGLLVVEIFTGFAMNSMTWGGWWSAAFGWIFLVLPANDVRLAHHLIMWLLLGFLVHHVYSSVLMDSTERSGILSSIVTGYKSIRRAP